MEPFKKTLEADISYQIPTLPKEDVQQLIHKVSEVAECTDDLPHVEPEDLQPPLKKATAKRFVAFLHTKYGDQGKTKTNDRLPSPSNTDDVNKSTENKPKVPTKPTIKYPQIPARPKPKSPLPSPHESPQAAKSHKSHPVPSLTFDPAASQCVELSHSNNLSTEYEVNAQDSDTKHGNNVMDKRVLLASNITMAQITDGVGSPKPTLNHPRIPPKLPPKPKGKIQEFDQDDDIKINERAEDESAGSNKVKLTLVNEHDEASLNKIKRQIYDSTTEEPVYLTMVASPSSSPAQQRLKKSFTRPCIPPPSPPNKHSADSYLGALPEADWKGRITVKSIPSKGISKDTLDDAQENDGSQGPVQIQKIQKLLSTQVFCAKEKVPVPNSLNEGEVITKGVPPHPLAHVKSHSVEHLDLVPEGRVLEKFRSSSEGCDKSCFEPENNEKKNNDSVFEKLRKFTVRLLSSDKADGGAENNEGENKEKAKVSAEGMYTRGNSSRLHENSATSEEEIYDDIVIGQNEKSSTEDEEIRTTQSLPDLPLQDKCNSASRLRTAWSENALCGEYVNFSEMQNVEKGCPDEDDHVCSSLHRPLSCKLQVNDNTSNVSGELEEPRIVNHQLVAGQLNGNVDGGTSRASNPCGGFDSDVEEFDSDEFDSDQFDSDQFDDDSEEDMKKDETPTAECQARKAAKQQQIVRELLTTERAYVKRLHHIDQVFYFETVNLNWSHQMFPDDVIPQMFSNIKSLYQFHNEFLLPQLEKRIADWDDTPKIGHLMSENTPFLKLYSEYVQNFEHAIRTINKWQQRSATFANLLADFQKKPDCGRLSLQDHMLEPIQRVPRYELLLKDYLKQLDENSEDRSDTESALELVTASATQANQAMVKPEKFQQLLELNPMFSGAVDLTDRPRELIKEGQISKVSARNGALFSRYLFLFTDMLLVCTGKRMQGSFHIHNILKVDSMQVLEGDNPDTPFTFYVVTKSKTVELHSKSEEEKHSWFSAIESVVLEYKERHLLQHSTGTDSRLGHCAPRWVKDQKTNECMVCSSAFSIIKRRHHCRCCGIVVCAECSSNKVPLAYQDNRPDRVCDNCCEALKLQSCEPSVEDSSQ